MNPHHPLQSSQSSNHDNPNWQPIPEAREANVLVDSASGSAKGFARLTIGVELTDHNVGWVGDNGTEDTGEVAARERDTSLSRFAVIGFLAWQVIVNGFDDGFE